MIRRFTRAVRLSLFPESGPLETYFFLKVVVDLAVMAENIKNKENFCQIKIWFWIRFQTSTDTERNASNFLLCSDIFWRINVAALYQPHVR